MANNKSPNQKQPGEKKVGKFHYHPGNMSGKIIGSKDKPEHQADGDKVNRRRGRQDQARR